MKQSDFNKISQRKKDLVMGYTKENENENNSNYAQLIKYLILQYYNQQDEFDQNATHNKLVINNNDTLSMKSNVTDRGYYSSYLTNVASKDVHSWRFRCIHPSKWDSIGIKDAKKPNRLEGSFHISSINNSVIGYKINFGGIANYEETTKYLNVGNGDIIKITLDLNDNFVSFKCMEQENMKNEIVLKIEKGEYCVGLTLRKSNAKYKLLSYESNI